MPKNHDFEISLRLDDLPSPHGFALHILDEYLQWQIKFRLDVFSKPLVDLMKYRYSERKDSFQTYLDLARSQNQRFTFQINGKPIEETTSKTEWEDIEIEVGRSYFDSKEEFAALSKALFDFLCLVLYLMVNEIEWAQTDGEEAKYEGALTSALVNKYERSRYNRAICLQFYGFECRGCGDALEKKYGPLGADVIHVHHIIPVSQMGGSYKLNPIRDLIPLCPNCHNIVHRINPPLAISDLHKITGLISN